MAAGHLVTQVLVHASPTPDDTPILAGPHPRKWIVHKLALVTHLHYNSPVESQVDKKKVTHLSPQTAGLHSPRLGSSSHQHSSNKYSSYRAASIPGHQ